MSAREIEDTLTKYFTPLVEENSCSLWNVEFVKEGPYWYIRVYIDKQNGVTIEDCELISRKVEKILDEKDPVSQSYILEVSSPGLDRPLKKDSDFQAYIGSLIDIKLYKAQNKRKTFQGKLLKMETNIISIDEDGEIFNFEKSLVASCRLAVIF